MGKDFLESLVLEQFLQVPIEIDRVFSHLAIGHGRPASQTGAKDNGNQGETEPGALGQDGKPHIGKEAGRWNFFDQGRDGGGSHQAVGGVGVAAIGSGDQENDPAQNPADQDAAEAVFPAHAATGDKIMTVARFPKPGEILRIALPVRIDLKNPGRVTFDGQSIAFEDGGAVPRILLPDQLQPRAPFFLERLEDGRGLVGRAVIQGHDRITDGTGVQLGAPLVDHGCDVALFIIDRHDNLEFEG